MPKDYANDDEYKRILKDVKSAMTRIRTGVEKREGMTFMPSDLAEIERKIGDLAFDLYLLREQNLANARKSRLARYRLVARQFARA